MKEIEENIIQTVKKELKKSRREEFDRNDRNERNQKKEILTPKKKKVQSPGKELTIPLPASQNKQNQKIAHAQSTFYSAAPVVVSQQKPLNSSLNTKFPMQFSNKKLFSDADFMEDEG